MKNFISILILMVAFLICSVAATSKSSPSTNSGDESSTLASNASALSASAPSTKASVAGDVQIAFEQTDDDKGETGNFFLRNWGILSVSFLAFCDVVARLTPSTKDNSIVNLLVTILNAVIPNLKKGGGRF